MKLNLQCGKNLYNGYVNVHYGLVPMDKAGDVNFTIGDFHKLNDICENNSVEEIVFNPLLNTLGPSEILDCLTHWIDKLRPGGKLCVAFNDIRIVGKQAHYGEVALDVLHNYVFGGMEYSFNLVMDINTMRQLCNGLPVTIGSISINDVLVSMEIIKNA